jgi:hypothetical protein
MRVRDAVLRDSQTYTDTETVILDLDGLDPISYILFKVHCTNGATSNLANPISGIVTKIEVVDGSDVIVSLSGIQLQAMEYYKMGRLPAIFPSEWDGGQQREHFNLYFGRRPWDKMYGFMPGRYDNPQLKVTFNKAAVRAASATGYASGDNIVMTVVAKLIEDGAMFGSVLMQKEIYSWTNAASGQERFDLPKDYPYRFGMLRSYKDGNDINENTTDLKITMDNDKYILFNRDVQELDSEALARYGVQSYKHDVFRGGSTNFPVLWNKEPHYDGWVRVPGTPRNLLIYAEWSSNIYMELYDLAGALDGTSREITGLCTGHCPYSTLPVWFGDPDDPDFIFNPSAYGKIEVIADEDSADAACSFVLEQVRPQ